MALYVQSFLASFGQKNKSHPTCKCTLISFRLSSFSQCPPRTRTVKNNKRIKLTKKGPAWLPNYVRSLGAPLLTMLYINGVSIFLQDLHPEMILSPISSKVTVTKEKERRKRNSEEKERRRREKSNGCWLLVFIMATLEIVFGLKRSTWR